MKPWGGGLMMKFRILGQALAVVVLSACGASDSSSGEEASGGPEFSIGAIENQCAAYAADWAGANAPDETGLADRLVAECCPKMVAAAGPLDTDQRIYLWTDTAAQMEATYPPEKIQAYKDTLGALKERLLMDARVAALAPRSVVFEACRRDITG